MHYITCEGRYQWLHGLHFKLLNCLRHKDKPVNLLGFVFNLLKKRVVAVQAGKPNSVDHHYLIRLLVEKALQRDANVK